MAIKLPVQAVPDGRSFDRTAEQAEKRFAQAGKDSGQAFTRGLDESMSKADPKAVDKWVKAYDKLADATDRIRVEEAKLKALKESNASDARLISQSAALEKARRAESRAVRDAQSAYDGLSATSGKLFSSLSSLAAGTRFGGLIGDAEALTGRFGAVGLAVGGTTIAVAGLAVGIGAAGGALYELGAKWDSVADGITARTGKIGDDLQAVTDQVTRAAMDSAVGVGQLGDIAGRVSASIGATGDQLGDLTAYLGDLNEMTGEQTNIRNLGLLYNVFKVQTKDQIPVLNELYTTFTKTQIPVNELIDTLVKAGPKAQQFGLTLGQTAGLITSFTNAGVPAEKAVTGLQKALGAFAKSGQDPKVAIGEVIDKIRELSDAGDEAAARKLAVDVFGARNFDAFLQAIQSGRIGTRQLSDSLQQNVEDIRQVRDATDDAAQKFDKLTSQLEVRLKPVSDKVFGAINDFLGSIIDQIDAITSRDFGSWWEAFNNPIGGPWSGGGGAGDSSPWVGGGADNLDGGASMRGTPGRGFPMPWTLPPLIGASPRGYAHQRMMPYWESQGFTVGDHASDRYGEHQNGAIDVMVKSIAEGNQVLRQVLQDPNVYGAIFNNKTYGYGHGAAPQDYSAGHTGNPTQDHQDHVHVWYKPGNAGNIKPSGMRSWGPRQSPPGFDDGSSVSSAGAMTDADYARQQAYWDARVSGSPTTGMPFGTDEQGRPGYYTPDARDIRSATERIDDVNDAIAKADQRIADVKDNIREATEGIAKATQDQLEAIQRSAELDQDYMATAEQKASAQKQVVAANEAVRRATEQRDRIVNRDLPEAQKYRDRLQNRDLRDANEALDKANLGDFKPFGRSSSSGSGSARNRWGAAIADDFGMSGGLPGIAENITNFLGNLAMAPVLGALTGVQVGMDPTGMTQGASGLIGMAAMSGMGGPSLMGGPLGGGPGVGSTVGGMSPGPTPGGGFGGVGGGVAGSLMQGGIAAAGMALDAMAPGAGSAASIAANIGIQEVNRAVAQVGKYAGIGVGGLQEAFSLSDPSQSWFGRIAGAVAGAKPALPNMAGGSAAAPGNGQQHGAANGAAPGPGVVVNYTNNQATEDRAGKDLTNHLLAMNSAP